MFVWFFLSIFEKKWWGVIVKGRPEIPVPNWKPFEVKSDVKSFKEYQSSKLVGLQADLMRYERPWTH